MVTFDPLYSLAHLPDALPLLSFFDIRALPVLLSLYPLANVLATVWPFKGAHAVFLVV